MDIKDVENLANMARIELSEEEKLGLLADMDSILGYVKQINEVEIGDFEPQYQVYNVWREDEIVTRQFSLELITSQFPDSKDGFLKVKKIL